MVVHDSTEGEVEFIEKGDVKEEPEGNDNKEVELVEGRIEYDIMMFLWGRKMW